MIRGVKSIAEYAIRRWLQRENFVISNFEIILNDNEAVIKDRNGETMTLVYDSATKTVYIKE